MAATQKDLSGWRPSLAPGTHWGTLAARRKIPGTARTFPARRRSALLSWAKRPNVEIRVLPFDAGLHSGMSGAFTLLSFPNGVLPDAGWQEYALGGHIIDDSSDVASLTTLYDELRSQALGDDESLTLLTELAENIY